MSDVLWRIYYDDDSTFSNLDGTWEQAPADGAIAVVVRDSTGQWGRFMFTAWAPSNGATNEFFVKHPKSEEPYATYDLGPFLRKTGLVKYGRQTDRDHWQAIMKRASVDPDFPLRSPRRRSTDFPRKDAAD